MALGICILKTIIWLAHNMMCIHTACLTICQFDCEFQRLAPLHFINLIFSKKIGYFLSLFFIFYFTGPQLHYLKSTKIWTKLSCWMLRKKESTKFYLTCSEKWMPRCSNGWFELFSKMSKSVLAKRKFLIIFMTTPMIFMTRMPTLERWVM